MIQFKNFFLILISCFFFIIDANAQSNVPAYCSEPGLESSEECKSQTIGDGSNIKGTISLPDAEEANIEHLKQQGKIKLTKAQISKIDDPLTTLRQATEKYTKKLSVYAENLFLTLMIISFAYQFSFLVLKRGDIGEFFAKSRQRKLRLSFS